MKYCPRCDRRYSLSEDFNYPVCEDCKDELVAEYEYNGIDWKFWWKLHTLLNTLVELLEMETDMEQYNLILSAIKTAYRVVK
jgi:predicted amidophosphoribosyltransferase